MNFYRNKYKNVKVEYNGMKFDSKKEFQRFIQLEALERQGKIENLERQKRFLICEKVNGLKGSRARFYIADFVYVENGKKIIEDVKSLITKQNPVYTLKKQLVQVRYKDYEFRET